MPVRIGAASAACRASLSRRQQVLRCEMFLLPNDTVNGGFDLQILAHRDGAKRVLQLGRKWCDSTGICNFGVDLA